MREKNSLPKLVQLWKRIELETLTCLFPLQLLTTQCKIHSSCANRLSLYLSYPEKQIPLTELVFKLSSCAGQPDLMFPFYLLFESLVKLICGMWVSLTLLLHLSIAPPSRLPLNWMSCNGVTKKKSWELSRSVELQSQRNQKHDAGIPSLLDIIESNGFLMGIL